MKQSKMSAIKLRAVLSFLIVLLFGLSGVGFYFAQDWLKQFSATVGQSIVDSSSGGGNLRSLEQLQTDLEAREDVISKTANIVTSSLTYQDQAIKDLDTYAKATGISIDRYDFTQVGATSAEPTSITVILKSPVSYTGLLKFLRAIETNLPKMQISGITLGRVIGDPTLVRADQVTVEVYTR